MSSSPSGISKLPTEILDYIFIHASNIDRPTETFLLKSGTDASPSFYDPGTQVNLSHVCRTWRKIALASPALWNTIHVRSRSHIDRARQFCSRVVQRTDTNEYPLSRQFDILILTVNQHEYRNSQTLLWKGELDEVFAILAPYTKQWRAFHLEVRDGECKAIARKYIGNSYEKHCGAAPNLTTWQLYHFEDFQEPRDLHEATHRPPVICFMDDIPKLRHLSLIGVNLPWQSPYLQNLYSLELSLHRDNVRPPFKTWRDMLEKSPNLERLFLHYSGPRFGEPTPNGVSTIDHWKMFEPIELPRLKHLMLTDIEPDHLEAITVSIRVPNVKKLDLDLNRDEDTSETYDDWVRSVSEPRSDAFHLQSLTSLVLTSLPCSDSSLKRFLSSLVELKELEIQYCLWHTSVWKILVDDLKLQEVTQDDGSTTGVRAPSANDTSPPLILPKLEILKVDRIRLQEQENEEKRYCNVKLLLRLREREAKRPHRDCTPIPTPDRASFAIVGTLPVKVMPVLDLTSDDISSERNRQTNVLRRLARADHQSPGLSSPLTELGGDRNTNWKVIVDVEDISDAEGAGDEDDDEDSEDYEDEDGEDYEDDDYDGEGGDDDN